MKVMQSPEHNTASWDWIMRIRRRWSGIKNPRLGVLHGHALRDLDAVKQFLGENWQTAVIDPEEGGLQRETFVHHHQEYPVKKSPSAAGPRARIS